MCILKEPSEIFVNRYKKLDQFPTTKANYKKAQFLYFFTNIFLAYFGKTLQYHETLIYVMLTKLIIFILKS